MQTIQFKDRDEWLEYRRGKITGTRLGELFGKRDKKPKEGYYELIAERIAIPADDENPMDRGLRLEDIAMALFAEQYGKPVDTSLVVWHRDDDSNIMVSPDGSIENGKEAVEVKCLASAKHIKAWLEKEVPSEYVAQTLQYFIVNEKLEVLHFVFYDPRMPKELFWFDITRESVQADIDEYLELERKALAEVALIEKELTF